MGDNDNEANMTPAATLIITMLGLLLFVTQQHYWVENLKEATELYCGVKYNISTLEYEYCIRTDLLTLLRMEKKR